MKYFRILFSAAALLLAASCIDNDVPYPVVELRIAGVEGSGFTVSGISIANRTVALTLDEKTDIRKVGIDKVTFDVATSNPMMTDTESFIGQIKTSRPLSGEFDLRSPLYVTLSLDQDYEWTIVAEQPIERAFTVAGQIGATVIDAQKRTATAYVAKGTNLGDITVTRLKLGPADITTYSPTAEELSASGFETMRFVDATYHGTTERWTLHVEHTDLKVAFRETDLWNNTGVITAMVTEEEYPNAVIQYRVKGTDEWQATQKGERDETGLFTAAVTPEWTNSTNAAGLPVKRLVRTKGVYAGQTYELRLLVNGEATETSEYTVPAGDVIPDGNMENPGLSCFTQENQNAEFWASGNNGVAKELCTSAAFDGMGGSRCALLKASAPLIVGLAAGNLMSGIFYKDGLTTGVVEFGQESKIPCDGRHRQSDKTQRSADRQGRSGQGPDLRGNRRLGCPSPGSFGNGRPDRHLGPDGNHGNGRGQDHRLRFAVHRPFDRRRPDDRNHAAARFLRHAGPSHGQIQHRHLLLDQRLRRLHGRLHDEHDVRRRLRMGLLSRER